MIIFTYVIIGVLVLAIIGVIFLIVDGITK
jgi:hypothetical protein